ncbi:P1 family peptidase [Ramlibacter tataouinensis]|uniref:P1 family peptidase n=1 Tax=Ramlibacter tataouinensis TaxID=94132 RepID=UPI0022F3E651|nr:P1 family peptidase [Ramlibacter tataouinensis]WBY02616.1 P1 family peptidase [Ramlibacter tataouinensis]
MSALQPLAPQGAITDVAGIEVGHFTHDRRATGCTVVLARQGAVAGVDVRGAAPGTRETDLLAPTNLVDRVHAVMLSGGSAWGLDAAGGAMRWLEEQRIGLGVGPAVVPIVPAAVLFDLYLGDLSVRPDAAAGHAACAAASTRAPQEGSVGAGAGALVGKIFGLDRAMKGGIGTASVRAAGFTLGALVACNALGDVVDPDTGALIAGARREDGRTLLDSRRALLAGQPPKRLIPGSNTTIGVIATDAVLTKAQAARLATVGHDGFARAINPAHTLLDGDTLFALGTGTSGQPAEMMLLATMAAEAVAIATVRAVRMARGMTVDGVRVPAASEL